MCTRARSGSRLLTGDEWSGEAETTNGERANAETKADHSSARRAEWSGLGCVSTSMKTKRSYLRGRSGRRRCGEAVRHQAPHVYTHLGALGASEEAKLEQLGRGPREPWIIIVRRPEGGDQIGEFDPPERHRVRAVNRRRCVAADDAYVDAVAR